MKIRKIIAILVAMVVVLVVVLGVVMFIRNRTAPANDFEYRYNEELEGIEITNYIGDSKRVIIPETIGGFPVVSISSIHGQYIVDERNDIQHGIDEIDREIEKIKREKEELERDIKELENVPCLLRDEEFKRRLEEVSKRIEEINEKNEEVEEKLIELRERLSWLEVYALKEMFRIGGVFDDTVTYVHLPNSIINIGSFTFFKCTALKNITLPKNNIIEICEFAFYGCDSLSEKALISIREINPNAALTALF